MTDDMDKIVKPCMLDRWLQVKSTWFVQNESDPYETRLPGLMKSEWLTKNGAMVA